MMILQQTLILVDYILELDRIEYSVKELSSMQELCPLLLLHLLLRGRCPHPSPLTDDESLRDDD